MPGELEQNKGGEKSGEEGREREREQGTEVHTVWDYGKDLLAQ